MENRCATHCFSVCDILVCETIRFWLDGSEPKSGKVSPNQLCFSSWFGLTCGPYSLQLRYISTVVVSQSVEIIRSFSNSYHLSLFLTHAPSLPLYLPPSPSLYLSFSLSCVSVSLFLFCNQSQYIFIHDALVEALTCGEMEVPVSDLMHHIQFLEESTDGIPNYEREYKVSVHDTE